MRTQNLAWTHMSLTLFKIIKCTLLLDSLLLKLSQKKMKANWWMFKSPKLKVEVKNGGPHICTTHNMS